MPSRDANESRPQRAQRGVQEAPQQQRPAPATANNAPEDAWDVINNMKGGNGGGNDGFNKMNTSFFLRDGEEADVVFVDEQPTIFFGHSIKCKSDAGKTFYRQEQCQKSEQDYCTMCDANNSAIGKANRVIGFRVIDSRGSWDSGKGELDGVPACKIFLVPLYLAKQIKTLKDDAGTIGDKIIKLSKNGNYMANFKMVKLRSGGFDYDYAPEELDEVAQPEILEVYAPMEDEELIDFIDKFADNSKSQKPASNAGTGRNIGGFGKK